MALVNCRRCGKLFRRITTDICPDCLREEEQLLRETRAYLREHPGSTRYDVITDLEIDELLIEKWIKEGSILVKHPEEEMSKHRCAICGREVREGQTYCRTCVFKQLQARSKAASAGSPGESTGKGMHYKVRDLKKE